jgi:hypothetical protein
MRHAARVNHAARAGVLASLAALGAGCSNAAHRAAPARAPYSPPPFIIQGDEAFRARVRQALFMLDITDPDGLAIISGHVGAIMHHSPSGMAAFEKPPTMHLAGPTLDHSLIWLASVLVHEAVHSRLYAEAPKQANGEPAYDAWGGFEAERTCNARQLETCVRLAAPETILNHLAAQDGKHGDVNKDGLLDYRDYMLRSW